MSALVLGIFLYLSHKNFSKASTENQTSRSIKNLEAKPLKNSNLETKLPSEPASDIKILFLGDIMFDRYIRQVGEKKGYDFLFQGTDNLLKDNDLVVGNLEGPITDNQSVSMNSEFGARENYIFTFDPQVAEVLKNHNINLVNIGNNHILNFGSDGLEQTKKYLDNSDVRYFCDSNNSKLRIANYELQNLKIAFVCYNQFESGEEEKTFNDIKIAKEKADLVVLYAHWGKEYETTILRNMEVLAHQFVDAGVDLIIGTHPHVIQKKEEYHGKRIYYSLGNFIFDQYFNPNAVKGLAVKVIITPDNRDISFQEYDLQLKNNGQTGLAK